MDRRFPIIAFDASRFAAFFGDETGSLQAELLGGGACNSNYLVRTRAGHCVCRLHHRGNPKHERMILESVGDLVPTPECLWVGDGVSVMSYIEGRHFVPTPNLVREAGRIIGRLSRVEFSRAGQLTPDGGLVDFEGWRSFQEGLPAMLTQPAVTASLDAPTISALEDMLEHQGHLLASFDACHSLVHGDFRPDNILVHQDSIAGVLDWEFAHAGCAYMDIGNLMRHISPDWEADLEIGLRDEGFDLPDDWAWRASLIDLASHLEFLTSNRSDEFKLTCVDRIHRLIQRYHEHAEVG